MKKTLLLSGLMLVVTTAIAQRGLPLWTNRYSRFLSSIDRAQAIAVDSSGNVFVTGESSPVSLQSDYVTVAYWSAGTPRWTNRYSGPVAGKHAARALVVDGSGNVFVAGYSASSTYSPYNYDYATIKYSNAGVLLWTKRYEGWSNGGADEARALAVDAGGNVFVTGSSQLGGSVPGSWYSDFATVAYSNAGTQLWTARYTGLGGTNSANAIALDRTGNVFVTGNSAALGGANPDYATVGYSNTGVQLWAKVYNGPGNGPDIARAIAVDAFGNVFVTGHSMGVGSGYDYATIKYSGTGVPLWINRYNGVANSNDFAVAVAVDLNGNVFTTGDSLGAGGFYDCVTLAYSGSGAPMWTNRFAAENEHNRGAAIAVDGSGTVFVTGYSSSFSYLTIAYSGTGTTLWTNRFRAGGLTPAQATALAVDSSGNVVVTGYAGSFANVNYATIKYSAFAPFDRLNFQWLNNELVLSWPDPNFSLQSAPAVVGPFTNVPGATSPYTNPTSGAQQYFRLFQN